MKSKNPEYYTAAQTATQLAVMMHRAKLAKALVTKELLMRIASNPGGASRERLRSAFLEGVRYHLFADYSFHSLVMNDDTLFVIRLSEIMPLLKTHKLKETLLTKAEWKGKIDWPAFEHEADGGKYSLKDFDRLR
jgi:hypothetical protein